MLHRKYNPALKISQELRAPCNLFSPFCSGTYTPYNFLVHYLISEAKLFLQLTDTIILICNVRVI